MLKFHFKVERKKKFANYNLWTLYFDSAGSKRGRLRGRVHISSPCLVSQKASVLNFFLANTLRKTPLQLSQGKLTSKYAFGWSPSSFFQMPGSCFSSQGINLTLIKSIKTSTLWHFYVRNPFAIDRSPINQRTFSFSLFPRCCRRCCSSICGVLENTPKMKKNYARHIS